MKAESERWAGRPLQKLAGIEGKQEVTGEMMQVSCEITKR